MIVISYLSLGSSRDGSEAVKCRDLSFCTHGHLLHLLATLPACLPDYLTCAGSHDAQVL